jgi:hypothetical protein
MHYSRNNMSKPGQGSLAWQKSFITLTWKVKCLKTLNICFFLSFPVFSCFFRRREIEFALAHRRLSFQYSSRSSLLYRSVFNMAAIQWVTISVSNNLFICRRILARFSVDFGFILLCTSLEVDWLGFFRATSLEMQYLDQGRTFEKNLGGVLCSGTDFCSICVW